MKMSKGWLIACRGSVRLIFLSSLSLVAVACNSDKTALDRENCLRLIPGMSISEVASIMGEPSSKMIPRNEPGITLFSYSTPALGDGPITIRMKDSEEGLVVDQAFCDLLQ